MSPEFPLRIITDDGQVEVIDSPEALMAEVDSIDSTAGHVWVRDAYDRTVTIVMRGGMIEMLEVR